MRRNGIIAVAVLVVLIIIALVIFVPPLLQLCPSDYVGEPPAGCPY